MVGHPELLQTITAIIPGQPSSVAGEDEKLLITDALREFTTLTCVHFVERSTENDFLDIGSGSGCWSSIGKVGGAQFVSLMKFSCMSRGVIQHEIQHALGFFHEQSRSDRDDHIDVMWQYINEADWGNFEKMDTDNLDLPYDFSSVLHYGWYTFSNTSGQPSLKPKPDPSVSIGQRYGLSSLDVAKVKKLYGCQLCSFLLSGNNGSLEYEKYMSEHPYETSCLWLIRVNKNKAFLQFDTVETSPSAGCSSNYITVYNGVSKTSPVLVDRACGNQEIPLLVASSGVLLVEVVRNPDRSPTSMSLMASYSSVDCGGTYLHDNGTVTSPGYPSLYPNLVECVTTIWAPQGHVIVLNFTDFDVEYSDSCLYDYLLINDGSRPSSPELGRYCWNMHIPTLISTGNVMLLRFQSDNWFNKRGYSANYYFDVCPVYKKLNCNEQPGDHD
ncbi:embryonic protein UVS.2-like [Rhinophrynus dorsalis]